MTLKSPDVQKKCSKTRTVHGTQIYIPRFGTNCVNSLYGVTCICVSGGHVCRSQAVPSVFVYCEWTSMPFYMSAGACCDLLHSSSVWWWAMFGKKMSHLPEVACLVDAVLQAWLGGTLDASDTASAFLLFCTNSYIKHTKKKSDHKDHNEKYCNTLPNAFLVILHIQTWNLLFIYAYVNVFLKKVSQYLLHHMYLTVLCPASVHKTIRYKFPKNCLVFSWQNIVLLQLGHSIVLFPSSTATH